MAPRIAVLELTVSPAHLMGGGPDFAERTRDWLQPSLPEALFPIVRVASGAPMADARAFDGFLLTGSEKGVYDDTAWMAPLRGLLLAAREAQTPVLGLCFGHQIMAETWGGRAALAGHGMVVGVRNVALNGRSVPAHFWHQDQVTELPPEAEVIAEAAHCPIAGLRYTTHPGLSVQFHPEFTAGFMGGFIARGREEILDAETTDRVVAELETGSVAPDLFADQAAAFFRAHL